MAREVGHILADILVAIEHIEEFTSGYDEEGLVADIKSYLAVQRALEIISEATRGIPEELRNLRPEVPWRQVGAFGNVLWHEYDGIASDLIWNVIADELPKLKAAIVAMREAGT